VTVSENVTDVPIVALLRAIEVVWLAVGGTVVVGGRVVVVVVGTGFTVSVRVAEMLERLPPSPPYEARTAWLPTPRPEVEKMACALPLSVAEPSWLPSAKKVTTPVGLDPATVAVKLTDWPETDGLREEATVVVEEALPPPPPPEDGLIVRVRLPATLTPPLAVSVVVIVIGKEPLALGVPLNVPVVELKATPVGSAPDSANVYGPPVPPLPLTVAL